jgi:hypothetical protein
MVVVVVMGAVKTAGVPVFGGGTVGVLAFGTGTAFAMAFAI